MTHELVVPRRRVVTLAGLLFVLGMLFARGVLAELDFDSPDAVADRIGSGDPLRGAGLAASLGCSSCHGDTGKPSQPEVPRLDGQYADVIVAQLAAFAAGRRVHASHAGVGAGVQPEHLSDVAAHFAAQRAMKGGGAHTALQWQSLYAKGDPARDVLGCQSCHGANGRSSYVGADTVPVVSGQQHAYLRAQLLAFRQGLRKSGSGNVMGLIAKRLSDEEIDGLAQYMSGL